MSKWNTVLVCFSLMFSFPVFADENTAILLKMLSVETDMDIIQGVLQTLSDSQLEAIIGHYGYGEILNDTASLKDREWSPDTWASALDVLSGGNNDRYNELLESYKNAHPTLTQEEVSKGSSSAYATDYQQMVATNQASSTQASYAFNDTNTHLENIKAISDRIEQSDNTKSTEDLIARMNAEIAYLQVEQIKGLAVINQQLAQQQASELVNRKAAAEFNKIPEENEEEEH